MSSIVLFGGSGFVGMHLAYMLGETYNKVYIADIRAPRWHNQTFPENPRSQYVKCDVRNVIDIKLFGDDIECIVNLAAVHTSPGHPSHEYFDTNINGAKQVCAFAEEKNVNKIIFTSSISVYGPGEDEKNEESLQMPAIPYGSSKAIAEYIHREWFNRNDNRMLCIIRPAVIFGQGEGGNFTRIANALEKGFFPLPGRTDTIKGCLYVKDICRFIMQTISNGKNYSLYNFCYREKITISQIVQGFKKELGYRAFCPIIPLWIVTSAAKLLGMLYFPIVKKLGLVPDRIIKLVKSTNISSQKLLDSGFLFKYNLESALKDWANDCVGKRLY